MLSDEWVKDLAIDCFADDWAVQKAIGMIRETEAEVRKQDTELIRQMLAALEWLHLGSSQAGLARDPADAVTAARARLEPKP